MKIYVGNFPLATTEKELRQTFESFGKVESTEIIKEKGNGQSKFAFVIMPSMGEACSAIKGLNGKQIKGAALLVNEAIKW